MVYADADFYWNKYLAAGSMKIPDDAVSGYLRKGSVILDQYTFGRVAELLEIPEEVRLCVCELAELQYKSDTLQKDGGIVTSWSNDGQSGSMDISSSRFTGAGYHKAIREIVNRNLHRYPDLIYTGG
ncbi:MAG: hypothetical protein PUG60_10490 [Lachnospiraceae bacterium]|nr:hypothetical protein [Lachnospiraceae bacterium]